MIFGKRREGSVRVRVVESGDGKIHLVAQYFSTELERNCRWVGQRMRRDPDFRKRSVLCKGRKGLAELDIWAVKCHWGKRCPQNLRQVRREAERLTHEYLWQMARLKDLRYAYSVLKKK